MNSNFKKKLSAFAAMLALVSISSTTIATADTATFSTSNILGKTSNAEDYGELSDMFESIKETTTINNKKYTITYNKDKQDRVELTVE